MTKRQLKTAGTPSTEWGDNEIGRYALFGGDSVVSHFQHSGSYSPPAVPQNGHCASKLTRTTILLREHVCDTVAVVSVASLQPE